MFFFFFLLLRCSSFRAFSTLHTLTTLSLFLSTSASIHPSIHPQTTAEVLIAARAVPRQEPGAPQTRDAAARARGIRLRRVRRAVRHGLLQPAQLLRARGGHGDWPAVVRVPAV